MRRPAPLGTKPTRSAQAAAAHAEREWWCEQLMRLIPHMSAPMTAAQMARAILGRDADPHERFSVYTAVDLLVKKHELERNGNYDDGSYTGRWLYHRPRRKKSRRVDARQKIGV